MRWLKDLARALGPGSVKVWWEHPYPIGWLPKFHSVYEQAVEYNFIAGLNDVSDLVLHFSPNTLTILLVALVPTLLAPLCATLWLRKGQQ